MDLIRQGAGRPEIIDFVIGGEKTAITIRIPENLRNAAKERAAMQGMSFSALIRNCLISELAGDTK